MPVSPHTCGIANLLTQPDLNVFATLTESTLIRTSTHVYDVQTQVAPNSATISRDALRTPGTFANPSC